MVYFFGDPQKQIFAVKIRQLSTTDVERLEWLFSDARLLSDDKVEGVFIGPRPEMITPWSTNAVEISGNMGASSIERIEYFKAASVNTPFDPMLFRRFDTLHQGIFDLPIKPQPIKTITDIASYNREEGLSLNDLEIDYLERLSKKLGRPLTDSEVFGFSQVNSEHCRHKIFNARFIIDGQLMPDTLFRLIKKTTETNPGHVVSAYKDNVAFIKGPLVEQFAPASADQPDYYERWLSQSVISLKAETHNFPTTVEPFNGAATGSGGEIRDRMAGGRGSVPLAGTAVYMTSYPRLDADRAWETSVKERPWLYKTPSEILIKASNGASDFGNKFGQPLIVGSLFTFEHQEKAQTLGFDKAIMLAGGVGYAKEDYVAKHPPKPGDKIFILGGDNYRIGMGGAAVSSSDTGAFDKSIELNAVQRSNPEMQKRVANVIRAFAESDENPIVSIHDHGAGGHLNCLSELVEEQGGIINISKLPIGDPTLSDKEIIGNESQERMGLIIAEKDKSKLARVAERERAPFYEVGEITGDKQFTIVSAHSDQKPIDLNIDALFGDSPKIEMTDAYQPSRYKPLVYDPSKVEDYLKDVLTLESVACKDWLTNKVDRCVGGKVAKQQCVGALQLPLNNVGVIALDYRGSDGIATSIGHSPLTTLIDIEAGVRNSIAEALTNLVWAPLKDGLAGVSLSANWMWACKNPGEDARLYRAVAACSRFAIDLGINIPTGKDSLSMTQKYPDGKEVKAPGTVIISAAAHCDSITNVVEPVFQKTADKIYYLNLSQLPFSLGGSAFSQTLSAIGADAPSIKSADYFRLAFDTLQSAIRFNLISAGHDVSSGGLITTLLEMAFADTALGAELDLSGLNEPDIVKLLFSENAGVVIQAKQEIERLFSEKGVSFAVIGQVLDKPVLNISHGAAHFSFKVDALRDVWYRPSYLLDCEQSGAQKAKERYDNYKRQPLKYQFPEEFSGTLPEILVKNKPKAAVIREKGSNSEREFANALHSVGFQVKDVHMTDLISGRETLEDIRFLGAVGGFSNSDVLGSAKGWAGTFLYNAKANAAIRAFFERKDTLSLGICNGCQLFIELGLIETNAAIKPTMQHNLSGKFESVFTSLEIQDNRSVMMQSLAGCRLGVWSAHGEGRFSLPEDPEKYHRVATFGYENYPASPNGSDYNTAILASTDGRHLASMPHPERSFYPWNWAYYPGGHTHKVSPWALAFLEAYKWLAGE